MRSTTRPFAIGAALIALIFGVSPSGAAGYPDHPVKIVVPFAPAGPTDVMARLIGQKLSENLNSSSSSRTIPAPAEISARPSRKAPPGRLHDIGRKLELCGQPKPVCKKSV